MASKRKRLNVEEKGKEEIKETVDRSSGLQEVRPKKRKLASCTWYERGFVVFMCLHKNIFRLIHLLQRKPPCTAGIRSRTYQIAPTHVLGNSLYQGKKKTPSGFDNYRVTINMNFY